MSNERPSRRQVLAVSASAVVGGGLSGCGSESGDGTDDPGKSTTETDRVGTTTDNPGNTTETDGVGTTTSPPDDAEYGTPYRAWTPANSATDGEAYRPEVGYYSYDSIRKYRDEIGVEIARLQPLYNFFTNREGVDPGDVRAALTVGESGVYLGSFDADTLAASLRDLGSMGEGEDYRDYRGIDARSFWLVGPEAILTAETRAHAVHLAETRAGEQPRAFEGSSRLDAVANAAGPGTAFYAAEEAGLSDPVEERPANVRAVGHSLTLGSDATAFDFVFDHDDGAPEGFAADAEASIRERYPVGTVEATQSSSRVTYRGTIETSVFADAYEVMRGQRWGSLPLPGEGGRGRR